MADRAAAKFAYASLDENPQVVLEQLPDRLSGVNFLEIDHAGYGTAGSHLIRIGHRHEQFRPIVEVLAQQGWFQYKCNDSLSTFVRHSTIPKIWPRVLNGQIVVNADGLYYSVKSEPGWGEARSLIVVFSSMAMPYDGPTLSRYFEQNFSSIAKHVGGGLNILRIADLDGVLGGFYSPTTFVPDRMERVTRLIEHVAEDLGVPDSRVILYGASKGGTGALLYGLTNDHGWKAIAVDPVVDDRHYEEVYRDSHWTSGSVFLHRKVDLFRSAVDKFNFGPVAEGVPISQGRISLVTSPGSPLFGSIESLSRSIDSERLLFLESLDPAIKQHPDVSRSTLRTVTGLMNMWACGCEIQVGRHSI